ncbi:MAG: nucleoside-triphosphatase [Fidelibacterota bacterium]
MTDRPSKIRWIPALAVLVIALWNLSQHPVIWAAFSVVTVSLLIPRAARPLRRIQFWFAILILILVVPLFSSHPDRTFFIFHYDSVRFNQTLIMAFRGLILFLLFQVASVRLTRDQLTGFLLRLGMKNLEEMLTIARETVPRARGIWADEWTRFSKSPGSRRNISAWLDFLAVVFTELIRFTGEWPEKETAVVSPESVIQQNLTARHSKLFVVVGTEGAGKTTWVQRLIKQIPSPEVDGYYSPSVSIRFGVSAKNLVRILTGETRLLCTTEPLETELHVGKYFFPRESFEWANRELSGFPGNLNWIIVDEVGFLEMEGKGFAPGLKAIAEHPAQVVLTLRPRLQSRFRECWAELFAKAGREIHEIILS